jgi:serine phosphatase RsbU (regulator of sigma subunit)
MNVKKLHTTLPIYWVYFSLALLLVVAVYSIYVVNMVKWRNSPDFGWRAMYDSGPNFVSEVMESGGVAGLRVGDIIIAINGRPYNTFTELYFVTRYTEPGSLNTYTVVRDGKTIDITVPTGRLGIRQVLQRSGPIFLTGFVYIFIGVLVFLMKPRAVESWLFFLMTCLLGIKISLAAPSDVFHPFWFYDIREFMSIFLAAPMIHLALRFPKTRTFLLKKPRLCTIPYLLGMLIFVLYKIACEHPWESTPRPLVIAENLFQMLGVLFFLVSMVWNSLRDSSVVIRLQSQVILIGIFLGFFIPLLDVALRTWRISFIPDPAVGFAVFLSLFPVSIGYTIVKYDLFAIDTIVRRTYGYILSTGTVIGIYALLVLVLNVTFQSSEVYKSPLFSIVFALGIVVFFRPLHERCQGIVDRVFYRQHYDYRKTIKDISEAMISILDPGEIRRKLIGSVVKEMFLENGLLLLPNPERHAYCAQVVEGGAGGSFGSNQLEAANVLPRLLEVKKDALFRYEADLNPAYEPDREVLQGTFDTFASELMLPLMYKDEMRGIISLGRKKSGKMFTLEDLDLLRTITNQSSIALENAKLFEENIEKSRMEEELKIAHDLQSSMLPERAPQIEGFTMAAKCISAREVGGDFYDFIGIGGNGTCDRLAIIVGDVSGKAVSGALVMAASRSIFRVLSESNATVKEIMTTGNARLVSDVKKGMFVALLYAVLDSRARTMTLSNAGQTQPVWCPNGQGEPCYIDTEGDKFPLGILKEAEYEETHVSLNQGDRVVFYTDGVVEAMNDREELYGFERLSSSVQEGRDLAADVLLEKLMADVTHFVGGVEQHDDITIVVVKVE